MEPVIHTDGLTKRFGRTTALEDLDLDVMPGEVVGFLGPNGAGKTTTIRLLLGLLVPSAGRAELFGLAPRLTASVTLGLLAFTRRDLAEM